MSLHFETLPVDSMIISQGQRIDPSKYFMMIRVGEVDFYQDVPSECVGTLHMLV